MDLWDDLQWRGLAYQWTGEEALPARLRTGPITLYAGFDPSAPSLHHGNLLGLMFLRRFQAAGHRVIALAGGATGMIGDPTGRIEERAHLSVDQVQSNLVNIRAQMERFIELDKAGARGILVNNADWFAPIRFLDFLRDVGVHASVNVMLGRESVKARLASENGITFSEFSYQLMQGYDFVHLYDAEGCELQTGGSDQFGNILAGVELGRRMRGAQLFGLTTPLLTRSDGVKFGKTASGAVWLDPELTSPYAFYQWFVRLPDADVAMMLRVFTELSHEEILALEERVQSAPERREAQQRLAQELTVLVHGKEGFERAERATDALFGGDIDGLSERELLEVFADVPSAEVARARLAGGIPAVDAFVEVGLAKSKGDARRLVSGGGAYVNNKRLDGEDAVLGSEHLATENLIVLRAGKRSFGLVRARD